MNHSAIEEKKRIIDKLEKLAKESGVNVSECKGWYRAHKNEDALKLSYDDGQLLAIIACELEDEDETIPQKAKRDST